MVAIVVAAITDIQIKVTLSPLVSVREVALQPPAPPTPSRL